MLCLDMEGNGHQLSPLRTAIVTPMALTEFARRLGRTAVTLWRWRKLGWLQTTNIAGRQYLTPEHLQEFNRRAAAGEFAREPKVPRSPQAAPMG